MIVAGYIHSDEGEYLADRSDIAGMGGDRASMRLHQRDIDLIHGVKGVNPNTVVSIIGSSAILIDEWEKMFLQLSSPSTVEWKAGMYWQIFCSVMFAQAVNFHIQ